jgi:undecaprenyl pyrophosphate synthase
MINGPEHPDAGERLFDWLWLLGTEISDICVGAQVWWDRVVASATEAYNRYSKAESSHRIDISASKVTLDNEQMRSNSATVNLLKAIPANMKDDFNGSRVGDAEEILFKIMVLYQPGGREEIAALFLKLQNQPVAQTAEQALVTLRRWERH